MGLLDFNITEIASRMVRGAAVRGRIRPTLDDGVIPIAKVIDYSRAPYRLDEQKFFACIPTSSAAAGDGTALCLLNKSPKPIIVEWWRVENRAANVARLVVSMQTRAIVDSLLLAGGDVAFTCYENAPLPSTIRNDIILRNGSTVAGIFPVVGNLIDCFDMVTNATGGTQVTSPSDFDLVVPPGVALVFSGTAVTDRHSLQAQIRVVNNTAIP